jgi:pimeloyl-ACP methyl ester carboxylesterase
MVAMVTAGYVEAYPELDPNDMLDQPVRQLEVARNDCNAATNLKGTTTRLPNASWRKRLRQNDPAISKIGLPVLLTHGQGDLLLGTSDVESTYRRLCRQGSTVQFDYYEGADHLTVRSASTFDVFFWLQDRLAGIPTTGCERRLIPA